MTNFSLDDKSALPSTISPSQNWQVAAPYFSRSKKRWLQKKGNGNAAPQVGAPPALYPATVLEVSKDRTHALLHYHDEPPNSSHAVAAEYILYPATAAPVQQRCNRFEALLWEGPGHFPEPGIPFPPLPVASPTPSTAAPTPAPLPTPCPDRATVTTPRRFEMDSKTGGKFWQIAQNGQFTTVSYGAVGAKPHMSERDHTDTHTAAAFAAALIEQKQKKGYSEVADQTAPTSVTIAKWGQKCSCDCGERIHPGDDIVACSPAPHSSWAIREHIEEPWNHRPASTA